MPFTSKSVSVGTTAVEILPSDPRRRRVSLHNATGAGTTYLGGSDVTTSNGFDLVSGERLHFTESHPADCSLRGAMYAVNSSGTNTVRIIEATD